MRIRRSARMGGLLVAAVATLATAVPPASAEGVGTVVFRGTANVTTGLGAPGLTGTPGVVADPTPGKKGLVTVTGGNARSGTFASATCLGLKTMVNKNKPNLVPGVPVAFNGPNCAIMATFVVNGFCGLSSGGGTGTITFTTPALPPPLPQIPPNTISFNFTWVDPGGGNLLILGNWWFGVGPKPATPDGDLVSFVKATPAVTTTTIPPTQSCTNKTQRDFDIVGVALFVHPKVLPS